MKRIVFSALFLAVASIASASSIYQTCPAGAPTANVNPPTSANLTLYCGSGFVTTLIGGNSVAGINTAGGDYITGITLYTNNGVTTVAGVPGASSGTFSSTLTGAPDATFTLSSTVITGGSNEKDTTINCSVVGASECTAWYNYLTANTGSNQIITVATGNYTSSANSVSISYVWEVDYSNSTVPEPATLSLIGGALLGLGMMVRRKRA
jgi:hypothetical protein